MPSGDLIQPPFFFYQICIEEVCQDKAQRYERKPDGFSKKKTAEESRDYAAENKGDQHDCMGPQPLKMGRPFLGMADRFCKSDSHLPDVIGTEGGGHWNTFCLAEGIVLHGADEVDQHLGDLDRSAFRQKTKKDHHKDFNKDQQGIPTYQMALFYIAGKDF